MTQLSPLSHALQDHYKKDATEIKLSSNMESEILLNSLVLNGLQLGSAEIPCLIRFLSGKEAVNYIETLIIISKPHQEKSGFAKKVSAVRNSSSDDYTETVDTFPEKLLRAVILFISKSLKLHTVIIDSVRILPDFLFLFGEALSNTKSAVRWLSFKNTPLGDMGMRVLSPHIGRMQIQVLVLERCGLSDESCPSISSIIKSQEAMLDSLYWNATLRLDLIARDAKPTVETDLVCCQGLVALSLNGNYITDIGMGFVRRAIKSNHWLLGLNIAHNKMGEEGVSMLFKSLKDNDALLAVLLGGNPGFFPEAAPATPNTVPESASRLSLLPKGVSMLLKRWTKLQHVERERERERDRDREASGRGAGDTSDILLNLSLSGLSDRQYGHGAAFSAGTSHQSRCNQSAGSAVKSRRVTTQPPANGSVRAGYLSQVGGVGSIVAKRENDGEFDGDAVEWSVRSTADSENMTFDIDKSWCEEGSGILDMGSEDLEIPSTGASTSAATGQGLGFGPGDADAESSAYGEDLWGLTDRVTDHSTRTLPRCKLLLTDFLQDASVSTEVPRQPYYRGPTAHAPYLPGVLSTDFTDPVSVTASAASTRAWPVPFGWDPSFTPQVAPLQTTKSRKGEGRKLLPSSIPAGTAHVGRKDDIVFLDSLGSSVGKLRRRHSSEGVRVSRPASSYEFEVRRQGGESLRLSKGDAFKDKEIGGHRPVRSVRGKVSLGRYHTARSVSQAAKEKVKHPDTRSSGVFLIRAIHTHSGNSSGTPRAQPDGDRVRVERESRRPPRRLCKPSLQVALKHTRKGKAQRRLDKAAPGPSTPSELFAVQQVALDQIMGHFSESVMEISESLGNVSAQLRDVTATISESMSILELSRSRGSSPNKSLTPGSASKVDPKQHRTQRDVPTPTHTRGTQMQREEQADDSEALYHDMLFNDGHGSDSGSGDGGSGGDGVVSPSKKGLSEGEYLDSKKRTTMRQEERKREKEGGREEREREVEETASQERETSPLALPPLLVESHPSPVKTVLPRSDDKVLARSDDEVAWARLGLGLGSGVNSLEGVKSPSGRTQVPAGPYMVTSPGIFISERGTGLSSPELCVYEDDREISHREIALMIREGLARKLRAVLRPSVP